MAKITNVRERVDMTFGLTFDRLKPGETRHEYYLDAEMMETDGSAILQELYTSGDVSACTLELVRIHDNTVFSEAPAVHFDSSLCRRCEGEHTNHPHALQRAILLPPRRMDPLHVAVRHEPWSQRAEATVQVMLRGLRTRDVEREPKPGCLHDDCRLDATLARACRDQRLQLRARSWRLVAQWIVRDVVSSAADLTVLRRAVGAATDALRLVTVQDVEQAIEEDLPF